MQESEQAAGAGDGQGSLACRSPWGRKESDATELKRFAELVFMGDDACVNVVGRR